LFELRSIIEPEAAALAAERRSADDLSTMRAALQAMERHGLAGDEGQSADREFHRAVLAATRNPPLYALSSSIGAAVRWTTIFKQRKRRLPRDPVPDHWRVFEAIDAGDAAAARVAMRCLVALALEDTRLAMKS
jgi:DNA-binding FadR family transcriptional regulator